MAPNTTPIEPRARVAASARPWFQPMTPCVIACATVLPARLDCCRTARWIAAASGLEVAASTNSPLPAASAATMTCSMEPRPW